MDEPGFANQRFFDRWVRATWAGWLLGIPLIIALALAGEAVSIGGAQFLIGVGMGTGVGLMQGRVLRPIVEKSRHWLLSCVFGLGWMFAEESSV